MEDKIKVISNDIHKRKGKIAFSRQRFESFKGEELEAIFSNFFPVAILAGHGAQFYDSIVYYGVSPHFKLLDNAFQAPEYMITLKTDPMGKVEFDKVEEVDSKITY